MMEGSKYINMYIIRRKWKKGKEGRGEWRRKNGEWRIKNEEWRGE